MTTLSPADTQLLRAKLAEYEGNIPYMYLDSKGYVTVGIGHMLATAAAAQQLPFYVTATNKPATPQQIQAEFARLQQQPKNRVASFYKRFTTLSLPDAAIDAITDQHIAGFATELSVIYPDFDTYPSAAQLALFDMIFNLGATNLRTTWPKMNAAIKAQDWNLAAQHSKRAAPISDERNEYVRKLFVRAARTSVTS